MWNPTSTYLQLTAINQLKPIYLLCTFTAGVSQAKDNSVVNPDKYFP
jgi:hypothetical protein